MEIDIPDRIETMLSESEERRLDRHEIGVLRDALDEILVLRMEARRLAEIVAIHRGGDTMSGNMPSDVELAEMLTELAESYDSICEGEKANLIRQAANRIRDQRGTINTLRAEVIVLTEKVERRGAGS